MPIKICNGICKRFMAQIKTRHSWISSFDYRVYDFRVVRTIAVAAKRTRHNLHLRFNKSEEYLRCNKCFMIPEMAFIGCGGDDNKSRKRCPCCNTQLSYGRRHHN